MVELPSLSPILYERRAIVIALKRVFNVSSHFFLGRKTSVSIISLRQQDKYILLIVFSISYQRKISSLLNYKK